MVMKTITNPKKKVGRSTCYTSLLHDLLINMKQTLKKTTDLVNHKFFAFGDMTTLQATPPTEQLVMELGLRSALTAISLLKQHKTQVFALHLEMGATGFWPPSVHFFKDTLYHDSI